jgi:hypothetical protein
MAVHWLTRGNTPVRVFELRAQTLHLSYRLHDIIWLQRLANLADTFTKLSELNLILKGKDITVFSDSKKIVATERKLESWCSSIGKSHLSCFSTLDNFLSESNLKRLMVR